MVNECINGGSVIALFYILYLCFENHYFHISICIGDKRNIVYIFGNLTKVFPV